MRKAQIVDGKVVNVIVVDDRDLPDWCKDWPDCQGGTDIGAAFDGKSFVNPAPVEAAPVARDTMRLTFAQLLIGLVAEGWMSEADGDGWLSGALPAPVLALIDTLPPEQRFPAKARALRPSEVMRADPLVGLMATAQGHSDADLDAFFLKYGLI